MGTVVLLGFSTAGKSTILKSPSVTNGNIATLDTDSEVAKSDHGHIYNIFFERVCGACRLPALKYIERREREVLSSIEATDAPRIIAAGPWVTTRHAEWENFCERTKSNCLYLKLSPHEVYDGLINRRKNHIDQGLGSHPAFGSWDEDVTTEYRAGRWFELPKEVAIKNITSLLASVQESYEGASAGWEYEARSIIHGKDLPEGLKQQIWGRIFE